MHNSAAVELHALHYKTRMYDLISFHFILYRLLLLISLHKNIAIDNPIDNVVIMHYRRIHNMWYVIICSGYIIHYNICSYYKNIVVTF